jgi:hypothetical protein
MVLNLSQLIKSCGTSPDPAAETKSMGLSSDALAVMVFAASSGQFYLDETTSFHLFGLCKNACQPDVDGN